MLVPFLIMLREGMEAALIVGIVASYLRQTGRRHWLPAVWLGVVSAALLCLALGLALNAASAEFPQREQEMFEAAVGLVAVVVLTSMVFWMRKAARSIGRELRDSVDTALRPGGGSGFALVAMVFLAVGREGLESVFFLLATVQQDVGIAVPIGAFLGLLCATVIGGLIYLGGVKLDLRRFFFWTGLLIVFVAAGLLAGSVRALHEAGVWNLGQTVVLDLSRSMPADSVLGTVFAGLFGYTDTPTLSEIVAYLLYLAPTLALFLLGARQAARAAPSRPAILGALALALALAGRPAHAIEPVAVTVTDKGCEPSTLEVPAGKTVFTIRNASGRALEWEILQGVAVVAERENIVPGFRVPLTATLEPGTYAMTCGLLSNPRGLLRVTATAESGPPAAPSPMDLVGPIAEYKVYVVQQVDELVATTKPFTDAVKAGDLAQARRLYAPARLHYERVEPIAELFNDLDNSIDARADDFERKEQDPSWTGFHRIEKGLFADDSTAGLAPLADKLLADTVELQKRLKTLVIKPKDMVGGAAELIEEVASKKIGGEEDRYSRTDLWDFQANVDGAQKIVSLLRPLLHPRSPQLLAQIDGNFATVDTILGKYKAGDGFQTYDALSQRDRNVMKGAVAVLAEDLAKLRGTLGVD